MSVVWLALLVGNAVAEEVSVGTLTLAEELEGTSLRDSRMSQINVGFHTQQGITLGGHHLQVFTDRLHASGWGWVGIKEGVHGSAGAEIGVHVFGVGTRPIYPSMRVEGSSTPLERFAAEGDPVATAASAWMVGAYLGPQLAVGADTWAGYRAGLRWALWTPDGVLNKPDRVGPVSPHGMVVADLGVEYRGWATYGQLQLQAMLFPVNLSLSVGVSARDAYLHTGLGFAFGHSEVIRIRSRQ